MKPEFLVWLGIVMLTIVVFVIGLLWTVEVFVR